MLKLQPIYEKSAKNARGYFLTHQVRAILQAISALKRDCGSLPLHAARHVGRGTNGHADVATQSPLGVIRLTSARPGH